MFGKTIAFLFALQVINKIFLHICKTYKLHITRQLSENFKLKNVHCFSMQETFLTLNEIENRFKKKMKNYLQDVLFIYVVTGHHSLE